MFSLLNVNLQQHAELNLKAVGSFFKGKQKSIALFGTPNLFNFLFLFSLRY